MFYLILKLWNNQCNIKKPWDISCQSPRSVWNHFLELLENRINLFSHSCKLHWCKVVQFATVVFLKAIYIFKRKVCFSVICSGLSTEPILLTIILSENCLFGYVLVLAISFKIFLFLYFNFNFKRFSIKFLQNSGNWIMHCKKCWKRLVFYQEHFGYHRIFRSYYHFQKSSESFPCFWA